MYWPLVTRLTRELVRALPQAAAWVGEVGVPWLRGLYHQVRAALPDLLPDVLDNALTSLAQSAVGWAASLSAALTSGAFSTAASIPHALLGAVLLVMGTYYMTADRARIAAFFHRTFPGGLMRRGKLVSARLWRAVLLQIRSQLMVSLAVTLFLMIALGVFRVRYGLLIGLGIGVADALPVLGAGLFLIPWSIAAFVAGDAGLGVLAAFGANFVLWMADLLANSLTIGWLADALNFLSLYDRYEPFRLGQFSYAAPWQAGRAAGGRLPDHLRAGECLCPGAGG